MRRNTTCLGLTALAIFGLAACSGGSSDPDTGTLTVGLMDMPVRDADAVWVCITQINVKPQGGPVLEFPLPDGGSPCDGQQFDLLSLQTVTDAAMLIEDEVVEAGPYNWIELELDATMPGQGADADGPFDSHVIVDGVQHDLIMPSGSVRLVSGFFVTAGQHTQITLDWDVQVGLSGIGDPMGQEGVVLRPAFRIIDHATFGTLNGTITTEFITDVANDCNADDEIEMNFDAGNVVYLFLADEAPDDEDENAPNPYATIQVMPNEDATAYVFDTIVAPGDFRLAFTCQGDNDLPESDDDDVQFIPSQGLPITITEGETTTVDFPLPL